MPTIGRSNTYHERMNQLKTSLAVQHVHHHYHYTLDDMINQEGAPSASTDSNKSEMPKIPFSTV